MLYLLAEDNIPDTMIDVLLWPVALTLLGWLIFYGAWWLENRLIKAPWKWIALVPILIAIYMGCGYVSSFREPVYNSLVSMEGGGKKMMTAHYGALVIPILGVIGIFVFHFLRHKLDAHVDE